MVTNYADCGKCNKKDVCKYLDKSRVVTDQICDLAEVQRYALGDVENEDLIFDIRINCRYFENCSIDLIKSDQEVWKQTNDKAAGELVEVENAENVMRMRLGRMEKWRD